MPDVPTVSMMCSAPSPPTSETTARVAVLVAVRNAKPQVTYSECGASEWKFHVAVLLLVICSPVPLRPATIVNVPVQRPATVNGSRR